jgi:hypothetical protein
MIKGALCFKNTILMHDVYLPIARGLARPLHITTTTTTTVNKKKGTAELYQLWRTDFQALGRFALVCKEAASTVQYLLWVHTSLGERERKRRVQVEQTRRFMQVDPPLIASASWNRLISSHRNDRVHMRSRVSLAFNGRIRIREYRFNGRLHRQRPHQFMRTSPLFVYVGMTLLLEDTTTTTAHVVTEEERKGRFFIATRVGNVSCHIRSTTFRNRDGALGCLRSLSYLGMEYWLRTQPAEYKRLERYCNWAMLNLTQH